MDRIQERKPRPTCFVICLQAFFPRSEPTACFLGLVGRLGPLLSLAKANLFVCGLTIYTQSLVNNPAGDYMNTFQQFFLLILSDFSVRLARS